MIEKTLSYNVNKFFNLIISRNARILLKSDILESPLQKQIISDDSQEVIYLQEMLIPQGSHLFNNI